MNRFSRSRRSFLKQASSAAIAGSAGMMIGSHPLSAFAQTKSASDSTAPARVLIDTRRTIAPLDRNLFGSFLEHLGRAIYQGIYDPGSKLSDANGFRKDVLDEIRQLGVPIVRYPGGNFVSGYNWLDGVGPEAEPPARARQGMELARIESVRHERIHGVVQGGRDSAADGTEFWHGHPGGSGGAGGILQCGEGNEMERPAAPAWHCRTAQCEALVPGQRDGRSLADRAHVGD